MKTGKRLNDYLIFKIVDEGSPRREKFLDKNR